MLSTSEVCNCARAGLFIICTINTNMGQLTSLLDEKFKNQLHFRQRSNNILKVGKRANTNQNINTILLLAHIYDKLFISIHPPQSQHLLFYIQACSNFSVTSHGNVVRDRNIHYKFNSFLKVLKIRGLIVHSCV
jgi:hypothetical protein